MVGGGDSKGWNNARDCGLWVTEAGKVFSWHDFGLSSNFENLGEQTEKRHAVA